MSERGRESGGRRGGPASQFLAAPGVSGWAVRSVRGSTSHATIFDPPPPERPAHLGRLLHESEMRPLMELTETRGEGVHR